MIFVRRRLFSAFSLRLRREAPLDKGASGKFIASEELKTLFVHRPHAIDADVRFVRRKHAFLLWISVIRFFKIGTMAKDSATLEPGR